jgi:hypothetical protein
VWKTTKSMGEKNERDAECMHEIAKSIKQKKTWEKTSWERKKWVRCWVCVRNRQVNKTKKDLRKNQARKNEWDAECMFKIAKSIKQKKTWEKMSEMPSAHTKSPSQWNKKRLEKKMSEKKKMSEMLNACSKSPSQ